MSSFNTLQLASDFDRMYPDFGNKFIDKWPAVTQRIVKLARLSNKLDPSDEYLITQKKRVQLLYFTSSNF